MRAALILAGGKSSRMGTDKAMLPFGGRTLLECVYDICSSVCDEVLIAVGNSRTPNSDVPPGARVSVDPGEGPLIPIADALEQVGGNGLLFVTACDTPLLMPGVLELLFHRAAQHRGAVAIVGERYQPLSAVYSGEIAGEVRQQIAAGERKAIAPARLAGVVSVTEAELRAVDPDLRSFRGCNTLREYVDLLEFAGQPVPPEIARAAQAAALPDRVAPASS